MSKLGFLTAFVFAILVSIPSPQAWAAPSPDNHGVAIALDAVEADMARLEEVLLVQAPVVAHSNGIPQRAQALSQNIVLVENQLRAIHARIDALVTASATSSAPAPTGSVFDSYSIAFLLDIVNEATADSKQALDAIQGLGQEISIGSRFDLQLFMNQLSQLSEMSTSVLDAANQAIVSMARNVKG